MDPVANIQRQVELSDSLVAARDGDEDARGAAVENAVELAELVRAMHDWRLAVGFDPYTTDALRAR